MTTRSLGCSSYDAGENLSFPLNVKLSKSSVTTAFNFSLNLMIEHN